jgi:folate-dependent phosphoribosylglycinamide formyltransferase PurN
MLMDDREPTQLRIVLLCSHRAPGLRELLGYPDRREMRVVGVVTSDPASSALPETAGSGVPCLVHDIRRFYRDAGAPLHDLAHRLRYDAGTARTLAALQPDLVVLAGYVHILTAAMLDLLPDRIISVHDSDLTLRGPDGAPRYRGLRSTRAALLAGERETRSTVHVVTPEVDMGPPLARSWAFEVPPPGNGESVGSRAWTQRDWMMRAAWGPLLLRAGQMYARRDVELTGGRAIIAGTAGPVTLERPADAPVRPAPSARAR